MGLVDSTDYLLEVLPVSGESTTEVLSLIAGNARLAERKVRRIVGDDFYDEVEGDQSHEAREDMEKAEATLAFYYAMPKMNLRITERGGFVTATGFDASRQELMSAGQMRSYRNRLYSEAKELLEPYIETTPLYHI